MKKNLENKAFNASTAHQDSSLNHDHFPNQMLPIFSVSELLQCVNDHLTNVFPPIWIRGEISRVSRSTAGHIYFDIKDESSVLSASCFKNVYQKHPIELAPNLKIELLGQVSLWKARGQFRLIVLAMREVGESEWFAKFEALKQKLNAQGLFSRAKRPPAPHPKAIGVITSPFGAAVHDVIHTLSRRAKHIPLIIYPAIVQGKQSSASLIAALHIAEKRREVDTLIICRGGGSVEDLWGFNDEALVRAIANSSIPIISGVGHETDVTLCDFAADVRAATPTAAAELASPDSIQWMHTLNAKKQHLSRLMQATHQRAQHQLSQLKTRLRHPVQRELTRKSYQLSQLKQRLISPHAHWAHKKHQCSLFKIRLNNAYRKQLHATQSQLTTTKQRFHTVQQAQFAAKTHAMFLLATRLNGLAPSTILQRGYVWVERETGAIAMDLGALHAGERVILQGHDRRVAARIMQTNAPEQGDLFLDTSP